MKIVSLELNNFRRFRQPLKLEGFSGGLNIVVEPNETGKSTLLEALRAALFVRHSANTELTRSYCPIGDAVAPRVNLDFEIDGQRWQVEKQFLRSQRVHLTGPCGRFESDAAEEHLQSLLGFERGNNKGSDPETRGALGLLWVEQASALNIDKPGRLVRDSVRSALEGEVGAITRGRRFDAVQERVEAAYAALRTGRAGKSTGRLASAEERFGVARAHRVAAEASASAHETTLAELEQARTAKRLVERELADPDQTLARDKIVADIKLGELAAERLATAIARCDVTSGEVERLDGHLKNIEAAEKSVDVAEKARTAAGIGVSDHTVRRDAAIAAEAAHRSALQEAREARSRSEAAAALARAIVLRHERAAAFARARARGEALTLLEAELGRDEVNAEAAIPTKALEQLKALDKTVIEARAVAAAGAVLIEIISHDGTEVRRDGDVVTGASLEITTSTLIEIGESTSLRVLPPGAGSASAQAAAAESGLADALLRHRVATYADAIARSDAAKAAGINAVNLRRQIETLCVADVLIGLDAGAAALKAKVAEWVEEAGVGDNDVDVASVQASATRAAEIEREAGGRHDIALQTLRTVEAKSLTVGTTLAGADRDHINAIGQFDRHSAEKSKVQTTAELVVARQELLRRMRDKDLAEQATVAFNLDQLTRRLGNIDQASMAAGDRRMVLAEKIARLEAMIATEGSKGLAGELAEARGEEDGATEAVDRLRGEADTLELLRTTLKEAQDHASRTFLGPVTRRVVKYVNRILPGCDVTFSEELGLTSITRSGLSEGCGDLSRGTQEQLAVLTRLAFADMLLDRGEPVSLILDDPLVYSDDFRLEEMVDILTSAAERMQVILLTCRERAFRHVGGTRICM